MSTSYLESNEPITLGNVYKAMEDWRVNVSPKNKRAGIPDNIWRAFFELEKRGYKFSDIKRVFAINLSQYKLKKQQLIGDEIEQSNIERTSKCSTPQETAIESEKPNPQKIPDTFCQVTLDHGVKSRIPSLEQKTSAAHATKAVVNHLKSTKNKPEDYLDRTTIIVECIHPNGHRLKIHTTQENIESVIQTFFKHGGASS